jgi:hypothetical protein
MEGDSKAKDRDSESAIRSDAEARYRRYCMKEDVILNK